MSPNGQSGGRQTPAENNLYTIILLAAMLIAVATAAFVAYKCYSQYGTLFKIP
jgi:hypothetical protein